MRRPVDVQDAHDEWTRRLWGLPEDVRMDDLPDEQKLTWPELPTFQTTQSKCFSSAAPSCHASKRLENPDINTITGPGRTAVDVTSDLRQLQDRIRAQALADDDPTREPIFQADYLLIRMATASSNLTFHRVSNGLFMTDARNAEV
eukprot:5985400-Pleurochrysis_carterae.AAC.1